MVSSNRTRDVFLALSLVAHVFFLASWWGQKLERVETPVLSLSFGSSQEEHHFQAPKTQKTIKKVQKVQASNTVAAVQSNEEVQESQTESSSGEGNSLSLRAYYGSQVAKLLEENKRYPRSARVLRQEGEVVVALTLDKTGKLLDTKVEQKSRYTTLNEASLETVRSVGQFPPIPKELGIDQISFSVPIRYSLKM